MAVAGASSPSKPRRGTRTKRTSTGGPDDNEVPLPLNPTNAEELRKARLEYLSKSPEVHRRAAATAKTEKLKASADEKIARRSRTGRHKKDVKEKGRKRHRKQEEEDAVYVYGPPPATASRDSRGAMMHGALDTSMNHPPQGHDHASKGSTRQKTSRAQPGIRHSVGHGKLSSGRTRNVASLPPIDKRFRGQGRQRSDTRQVRPTKKSRSLTSSEVASANDIRPSLQRNATTSATPLPFHRAEPIYTTVSSATSPAGTSRFPEAQSRKSAARSSSLPSWHKVQDFTAIARAEALRHRRESLISTLYYKMLPKPTSKSSASQSSKTSACIICCEDFPVSSLIKIDCDCLYCHTCLVEAFTNAVYKDPVKLIPVKCCQTPINAGHVYPFVKHDKEFMQRFNKAANDKVSGSCWCPNKACRRWMEPAAFKHVGRRGSIERRQTGDRKRGTCKCGMRVCLSCRRTWHSGKFCIGELELIEAVDGTDIKKCPKCLLIMERSEGCLHMKCYQCGHEFCWKCLGDNNGSHECPPEFAEREREEENKKRIARGKKPLKKRNVVAAEQGAELDPQVEQERENAAVARRLMTEWGFSEQQTPSMEDIMRVAMTKQRADPFDFQHRGEPRDGWFPPGRAHFGRHR